MLTKTVELVSLRQLYENSSNYLNYIIVDISRGISRHKYPLITLDTIKGIGDVDEKNLYVFISDETLSEQVWQSIAIQTEGKETLHDKNRDYDLIVTFSVDSLKSQDGVISVYCVNNFDEDLLYEILEFIVKKIKGKERISKIVSSSFSFTKDIFVGLVKSIIESYLK
ncbi:MAG: hypothetical protein PHU06_02560 [Gallionella sp.]|nr:hypothetical protein [Gallionella sp.]MDD4958299.1 hypothetical protein [Gallionella sp.]